MLNGALMKNILRKALSAALMITLFAVAGYANNEKKAGDNPTSCDLSGFTTYTKGGWSATAHGNNVGTILNNYFASVFPTGVKIGNTVNSATFTTPNAVRAFLDLGGQGVSGQLTGGNTINPTSSTAGNLGEQTLALTLNVKMDAAGRIGTNDTDLGDLVFVSGAFAGKTVNEVLEIANRALGGESTGYTFEEINSAADAVNNNFDNGDQDLGSLTCNEEESSADIQIVKTVDDADVACGQSVNYTITVTNNGPSAATGIVVSDVLPAGLEYVSSSATQGSYDNTSGNWNVGSLNNSASASLTLAVQVDCEAISTSAIDLGPAKDFNVFVLGDFTYPTSDTQGKLAVMGNATLESYSVGDQLPVPQTPVDVLVVGGDLSYQVGAVYGGDVVYGGTSNLPVQTVSIINGTVRHQNNPLDFATAKVYLEGLSTSLSQYTVNGTTTLQWGEVNMAGFDPYLNVFSVNGSDLTAAHTVKISVPNGAVVLVNILGTNIEWKGGLFVYGTAIGNVMYNFPEASNLKISGIDIRGSILAPFADVYFVSGVQNGQMIAKSLHGQGQFNLAPFHGNIPSSNIINVAAVTGLNEEDPVSENNSSSVTVTLASANTGGGSGNWQLVGNLPSTEIIMDIKTDANNNVYAAAITGYIYKSNDGGMNWIRANEGMYSGPVWKLEITGNAIYAASVTGVYKSTDGTTWTLAGLENKDVRSIETDNSGNIYAGTWLNGMFKSTDGGANWSAVNNGMAANTVVTSMTLSDEVLYTGTFGNGVNKSSDYAASWAPVSAGIDFIWAMASNSLGHIFAGTYGDGIYLSTDNGANWARTNFPATHIYSLIIDADDNIYAASYTSGIYVSSDNGSNWNNLGLAGQSVSSLMINPNSPGVFAATKSGQVYKLIDNPTSAKDNSVIPAELSLSQNYPNPFNPSTKIEVSVPRSGNFKLVVYDMLGQAVQTLLDGQLEAGAHSVHFNGSDLTSGIYIYKLVGENVSISKKMMLVK